MPPSDMACFTLRLPRAQIGYLRFVLEGYEGLGQLSSEPGRDEACLFVPCSRRAEARALIAALGGELDLALLLESAP